jgi:class 3 adenylate cyclase/tetratricopeptide (TPR) repeat protein
MAVTTCARCQHVSPLGAKFCAECGTALARDCARCQAALPVGAKFCSQCGASAEATPPSPEPRFSSPAEYTPPHIAEKILSSKGGLEGERKHVTVLFADIKGSMELLADRDPEDSRRLLDAVLERMMGAVHHYEGTVNQVLGDGIMALFGAPIAHEDHAVRACYAALRMQQSVGLYAEELHRSLGLPIHIRVGLNSGEVVVRSIGNDLHMDYTAVGQTTHLAARMEQMAMPGSILMSPDTLGLVEGYVLIRSLGPRPVKGLEAPLRVYEVTGASPIRSRLHAAAARGLTRFVGRDSEIQQLARSLDRARTGSGQLMAVVGDPGVGKSRLYWEFIHSSCTEGFLVLESTSVSYGKATAYLPVIDLLRMYFKVHDTDDARTTREKVTGKMLTLDENLRGALPALLSVLGLPVEDDQWRSLGATDRRRRILDAVKRLLLRESQVQPLVLLFEDLHWIDTETQALLDSLVDGLPTARVLLLVNYRPEYQHGWSGKSYYTQLRIDPLGRESAATLLDALVGAGRPLEPLKRLLIERTEGNPFFLEESVRALVEAGVLMGERGAFRLAKALNTIQVPATVQAVLAARIDRLPPSTKDLLQSAAVIGKTVPFTLLEVVGQISPAALRQALTELQAAEFLYETSLFPDLEYTFKHALTLEVAYQTLLRERRRVLHARVLAALEQRRGDDPNENAETLAHHAVHGEAWEPAASYLYRAGARAQAEARYTAAMSFYEAATEAFGRLNERADKRLEVDAYLELWSTKISTGHLAGLGELGEKVEALARALDDGPRLVRVQVRQAQAIAFAAAIPGTLDFALGRAREAATRADAADLRTRSYARFIAAVACRDMGRIEEAIDEFDQGAALFADAAASTPQEQGLIYPIFVSLCAWRSEALAALGRFDDALASAGEALRVASRIRHGGSLCIANGFLGYVNLLRGDLPTAIAVLERGLAISEEHDIVHGICANGMYLGWALLLSGARARGLECVEHGLERSEGAPLQWSRYGTVSAAAYLAAERPEEARRALSSGSAAMRERGAYAYRVPLLRLEAEILLAEDDARAALERAEDALSAAEDVQSIPERGRCHIILSRIAARLGDSATAQRHLVAARQIMESLGLGFWLAREQDR